MKCPYCGKDNDEKAVICEQCKAAIPHEEKKPTVSRKKRTRGEINGT